MDDKTMSEALRTQLNKLAEKVGTSRVVSALVCEGLSPRQSEKLALGDHTGTFRRKTVAAVKAVLSKQGRLRASA